MRWYCGSLTNPGDFTVKNFFFNIFQNSLSGTILGTLLALVS